MKNKQVRNYKQTIEKAKEFPSLSEYVEEYEEQKALWHKTKTLVLAIQDRLDKLLREESGQDRHNRDRREKLFYKK